MPWVEVMKTSQIGVGEIKQIVMNDDEKIALFHLDDGFYAIDDTCSHAESSLAEGEIVGQKVKCALHGAEFDIRTGEVRAFPAVVGVKKYETKVENDAVFINYEG